jgi:S1-C subfamily serine protease
MSPKPRKFLLISAVLALVLVQLACASVTGGDDTPPVPTSAVATASTRTGIANLSVPFEAVVQIWAMYYDEVGELQIGWTGSGTIISPEGLILSNAHVVLPDRYFPVDALVVAMTSTQDEEPEATYYAEVLQADATLDLAVIRVITDMDDNPVNGLELPYVPLGHSDTLSLGDAITILGYPGIGGDTVTLTRGEVSGFTSQPEYGQRAFIKTSATIAGGNSGGLAVDAAGNLIGVPTQLGYGGDDQYVDCRVLADTNRDGFVDDLDSCVPTGGFINALRPVDLAVPLIEAAQRGEISIIGGEEPETVSAPVESGTFTDDFSSDTSGWDTLATETYSAYYEDGEYFVEDIGGDVYYYVRPYLNFENVEMTIDVRMVEGIDIAEVDLVCRYVDVDNNYEFRLFNDGTVGISKWLAGEYVNLVELQDSGIDLGTDFHSVTISCDGSELSMSIDGEVVAEVTDESFASGDVALAVYNSEEGSSALVAFDNFEASVSGAGNVATGDVELFDDFSTSTNGWDESSEDEFARYYLDERYFIEVNPSQYTVWSALTQNFENVVINVDVNIEQAGHDGDIGILCRYEDADNHYALEVSEDGYFSIWKRVNGEVSYLVDWTASDLIPIDSSGFTVNAACDGAQLSVGIDGELLATATDSDFSSGSVGLIAGTWENGGLVVSFDNFEVIVP